MLVFGALFFIVIAIALLYIVKIRKDADSDRTKLWDEYINLKGR